MNPVREEEKFRSWWWRKFFLNLKNKFMEKRTRIIKDQSSLGQFSSAIAQICEEKGIDKDKVVKSIEAALAAAYKKDYGRKGQIIIAKIDEQTSETSFKQLKEVVDETTRNIEEESLTEEARQVPENARRSEEKIEKHQKESGEGEEGEISLPRFNPERDVLLEDAQKVVKDIKVGDYLEFPLEAKDEYGRIASQTAKQVIIQKIREAERESMYEEFKGKEGEIVNGTVQRIEGGKVFVDLGKSTGILFPSEQIPGEDYRIGQRLKLYIDDVSHDTRSLGITLSRRHPQLLAKLFELEVPEIFAGTIEIKAVAREAGSRSKIAVVSHDEDIDPIGSCVGQKGTRVQAVIDELNGEKIDIIEWVDDPEVMIAQALSPAKVLKVELLPEESSTEKSSDKKEEEKEAKEDSEENLEDKSNDKEKSPERKAIAYVTEDQLSLAIGKKGQNVRLAAKLTGWNINVEAVKTTDDAESAEEETEAEDTPENKDKEKKAEKNSKEEKENSETPEKTEAKKIEKEEGEVTTENDQNETGSDEKEEEKSSPKKEEEKKLSKKSSKQKEETKNSSNKEEAREREEEAIEA